MLKSAISTFFLVRSINNRASLGENANLADFIQEFELIQSAISTFFLVRSINNRASLGENANLADFIQEFELIQSAISTGKVLDNRK